MHTATLLALQDELEKISGALEDAHADYMGMMKQHMHNPQVVARLHPTERMAVFKHLNSPKNAGLGGKIVAKAGKAVSTFAKAAGIGSAALDVAGLGALAAPTIQHMRGKPMSEKNKNRMELAGLGTLGASVAAEHGKDALHAAQAGAGKLVGKLKGLASKMPKHAEIDAWNPSSGALISESGGSRALGRGTSAAKSMAKPKFDIGALKAAYQKAGVKPGLRSVVHAAEKVAGPSMGAMMNMHRLADAAKAAKPMAAAVGAGKALTNPNSMGRATHLAANVATGGHAWNPAAAAKRAISL